MSDLSRDSIPTPVASGLRLLEEVVALSGLAFLIGFGLKYAEPGVNHPNLPQGLALFGALVGTARYLTYGLEARGPAGGVARWIAGGVTGGGGVALSGLLEPTAFAVHTLAFGFGLGAILGLALGLGELRWDSRHAKPRQSRTGRQVSELWTLILGTVSVGAVLLVVAFRAA